MPKNNILKYLIILIIPLLIGLSTSCNETPTTLGESLLPDTLVLDAVSTDEYDLITKTDSKFSGLTAFNTGAILIGKADDHTAATLLRFAFIPDSLDNLTPDDFESVKLKLYPNRYVFGDSTSNNLSFNIHRVNRLWVKDSTNYDSVFVAPANYYDNNPIASYSGNIELADSLDPIEIDLPAELMTEWFETETVTNDDGELDTVLVVTYGIALVPDETSTVIRQFQGEGFNVSPETSEIEVIWRDSESELDTALMRSTLGVSLFDVPEPDPNYITIQGGARYRATFTFDVSSIPDLASIHKTQLTLTMNREKSLWGNFGLDSIVTMLFYADETLTELVVPWDGTKQGDSDNYLFPSISSAVETWVRTPEKTGLLYLSNKPEEDEGRQLDRMVFYGLNAEDETLRPKLTIIYSKVQEE